MPSRPVAGAKGVFLELDPEVLDAMRELAARNGRTLKDEATHAFVRHLGAPPVREVRETVPDLPPAVLPAEAPPPPKRPRGRPRKGGAG